MSKKGINKGKNNGMWRGEGYPDAVFDWFKSKLQQKENSVKEEMIKEFDDELKRQIKIAIDTGDEDRARIAGYANGVAHRILKKQ